MSDLPVLSREAQIYSDTYHELIKSLPDVDQKKVRDAVGKDNVTDKIVVGFIKRVIVKAESIMDAPAPNNVTPPSPPNPPQSNGTEDKGDLVPA